MKFLIKLKLITYLFFIVGAVAALDGIHQEILMEKNAKKSKSNHSKARARMCLQKSKIYES